MALIGSLRVPPADQTKFSTYVELSDFTVHVVTCTPRQKVKSWHKLERALILTFKDLFGAVPKCNVQGKHDNYSWTDEADLFSVKRLGTIIRIELSCAFQN